MTRKRDEVGLPTEGEARRAFYQLMFTPSLEQLEDWAESNGWVKARA